MKERPSDRRRCVLGEAPLAIDDILALASGAALPALSAAAQQRMQQSAATMQRLLERDAAVYGVTTSVGASVDTAVPKERAAELSLNVVRMHGCGTGAMLDEVESAAVLAVRTASLACGMSGVRPLLAERLCALLAARALPRIPSEGSVGASGDLTPLSYVAAALVGERTLRLQGEDLPAAQALAALELPPLTLQPKEALALMNGTAVSTALACLGWAGARRLARLSCTVTAMMSAALRGNAEHFDAFVHAAKPHPGQERSAACIRADLRGLPPWQPQRLQDRYSVRCTPHVTGVLFDALRWTKTTLETELNGVSDNPLVDAENERILHGGNFYGGHVAFVCDALKMAVANVACLLDRQLMLLCDPRENAGLPANLVGVEGEAACSHNGFKAVTIATSSLAAEALKLTLPASAFSRSTELGNQDKVPMATLAARDLRRVVELSEQVAAMVLLACCQAYDLRAETLHGNALQGNTARLHQRIRHAVPRLHADRAMDADIAAVLALLRCDALLDAEDLLQVTDA